MRTTVADYTTETSHEDTFPEREMAGVAFEKHYRVKELAGIWGLSPKTVTRIFADEAGVIRVANNSSGKRKYATLSIPESVALRVHERLGNQAALSDDCDRPRSLRIIRLNELDAGVSKGNRNIIKVRPAADQSANGKFIP